MKNAKERRTRVLEKLNSKTPVNATTLAGEFDVSRQIIVGDIALLRAEGHAITSTPRGYLLEEKADPYPFTGTVVCKHDTVEALMDELYTVVDYGGVVIDVVVDHELYGEIKGPLNVSSRYEADLFRENLENQQARPLSDLTGGIHMHHIGCRSKENFEVIKEALAKKNIAL